MIQVKYGSEKIEVDINTKNLLGILKGKKEQTKDSQESIIQEALEHPIYSEKLEDMVHEGDRVCIIISDITRAWQKMSLYLPYIVQRLLKGGVNKKDIKFICATGSHRKQSKEEHEILLGTLYKDYEILDHDCTDSENLVYLGETSFQTPVWINRYVAECDRVILTGGIVYHDLAGYGGGRKSILPGVASYETIMKNHALALSDKVGEGSKKEVRCSNTATNPIHLDMLEATAFINPSFLFNVILDDKGKIIKAVAGHYEKAHEVGQRLVDEVDGVKIDKKSDIVLASAGGYPKDINFYQLTKVLSNAKEAVKEGGSIILVGQCIEGIGSEEIEEMIHEYEDNYQRECAVREKFTVAKYIGYTAAEDAQKFHVILVSDIDTKIMEKIHIKVVKNMQQAIKMAYEKQGVEASMYIMPQGANTFPKY